MPPGASGPPMMVINCQRLLVHGTALLTHVLYTIREKVLATYWAFLKIEALEHVMLYSADHYVLGQESNILQAWHGHWAFLDTRWSQTWVFWCIPPAGGDGLPSPQFFARWHGTRGGHLSLTLYWLTVKPLGINWINNNGSLYTLCLVLPFSHPMELVGKLLFFIP